MATFVVHDRSSLQPCPINADWVREGAPVARARALSHSADGLATTVMWSCTPGAFDWHYDRDETLHVLAGRVVIDKGLPTERLLQSGDGIYFPAGSVATWHVLETVTKIAFVRRQMPSKMVWVLTLLRFIKHRGRRPQGMFGALDAAPA